MSAFISTRSQKYTADARNAIVNGLAPDGGLYVPIKIPTLDYKTLIGFDYYVCAARILESWFTDIDASAIENCCRAAYTHFDTPKVAPVVKAGDTYIVELFHGETCAFKDVALSLLPRILVESKNSLGKKDKVLILSATSGDTGSAAMNGFKNVPGTGITVFYPDSGVSKIQRKQMVCMEGTNVNACAVRGNFDDCQSGVKRAFATLEKIPGVSLSSANSINIARLVPQIAYYYTTYIQMTASGALKDGEKLDFIVPTGNFGDILAGYYAKRMGLPIGKLVCASNQNDVLTQFLSEGVYDKRRSFVRTSSPSMDILISSNLERLLYHAHGGDCEKVESLMAQLKENGVYSVDANVLGEIQNDFAAYSCDDAKTRAEIKRFYDSTGYLADPHTAVALHVKERYLNDNPGHKCAVLSTASPFKFPESVCAALELNVSGDGFTLLEALSEKTGVKAPQQLARLKDSQELHTDVIDIADINSYIISTQGKLQ